MINHLNTKNKRLVTDEIMLYTSRYTLMNNCFLGTGTRMLVMKLSQISSISFKFAVPKLSWHLCRNVKNPILVITINLVRVLKLPLPSEHYRHVTISSKASRTRVTCNDIWTFDIAVKIIRTQIKYGLLVMCRNTTVENNAYSGDIWCSLRYAS